MGRNNYIKNLSILEIGNIELYLNENKNPTEIGRLLNRSESTIRKEIKNFSHLYSKKMSCKNCLNYSICRKNYLCNDIVNESYCSSCKGCKFAIQYCDNYFTKIDCSILKKNHNVCNACKNKPHCKKVKIIYEAKFAIQLHSKLKVHSRKELNLNSFSDEFKIYLSDRIKHGISPEIIVNTLPTKYKNYHLSTTTLYDYIDKGLLDCCNLDLRNKVKRIAYGSNETKRNSLKNHHLDGRIIDNLSTDERSGRIVGIAEIDTVEGIKGGELLFTIMIPYFSLMLAFKIPKKEQIEIVKKLDELELLLGKDFYILFRKLIPDNGGEFLDYEGIERSIDGISKRTSLFYTHPYASYEKPHVENNHKLVRYLIEKGYDISKLSADDVLNILNRVNNYPRKRFNFKSPLEMVEKELGTEILDKLKFYKISIENLDMKNKFMV